MHKQATHYTHLRAFGSPVQSFHSSDIDLTELNSFHIPLARSRSTHISIHNTHGWTYTFASLHGVPEQHYFYIWAHTVSLLYFTVSTLFLAQPKILNFPSVEIPTSQDVNWDLPYRYHWMFSLHWWHPITHMQHMYYPQGIKNHNSELYLSQGHRSH